MEAPLFLDDRRLRLLLFGGKGGVGKTTCATATALHFAQSHPQGHFLLVSTDPAHSLLDSIGDFAPPPNLKIVEFDAQQCLTVFKTEHHRTLKEIAKRGTFLDSEDINRFLDLSLPGMDEIMAILEISDWVQDTGYDCVLLDTAPTGHTRRLLAMPELMRKWLEALDALLAKHRYMKRLFSGSYQYDEPDQFLENLSVSLNRMETLLQDPLHCRFVPVMLAEELSIRETVDLLKELERLKVPVSEIVVNKLFPENSCLQCRNEHYHQMRRLKNFIRNNRFKQYAFWGVPLFPMEALGKGPLGSFWNGATKLKIPPLTPTLSPQGRGGSGRDSESPLAPVSGERVRACPVLDTGVRGQKGNSYAIKINPSSPEKTPVELPFRVEEASNPPPPETKLLVFGGKGGVGKTTLACATAIRLAQVLEGQQVLLFSTDPAHSLSDCLGLKIGCNPTRLSSTLSAMEVNPQTEFNLLKKQYQKELARFFQSLLPDIDLTFDQEVMVRIFDLSPPGLDEIMGLTRVMGFLSEGIYNLLILDSAPTGHLMRLLELPGLIDQWLKVFFGLFLKYKHVFRLPKISQKLVRMSMELKSLRSILNNPALSALYVVSILTEMAFEETKDLLAVCERMKINAPALFLNLATPVTSCSLCSDISRRESLIRDKFGKTYVNIQQTLVYRQGEPRGLPKLEKLGQALYRQ